LAQQTRDDTFTEEVEDRLDNLFGDEEPSENSQKEAEEVADSPLRELKTIVLSIEWEITDEAMTRFVEQISSLQDTFKEDKIVLVFLQLLGSIGEYIRTNLGKSHPQAFKILNSSFDQLDKVVNSTELTENDRKKILSAELSKYKRLKGKLVSAKPRVEEKKKVADKKSEIPAADENKDMRAALEELKQLVQSEFIALRKELKLLREEMAARR
jgi:hypothetical protein